MDIIEQQFEIEGQLLSLIGKTIILKSPDLLMIGELHFDLGDWWKIVNSKGWKDIELTNIKKIEINDPIAFGNETNATIYMR